MNGDIIKGNKEVINMSAVIDSLLMLEEKENEIILQMQKQKMQALKRLINQLKIESNGITPELNDEIQNIRKEMIELGIVDSNLKLTVEYGG